MSETVLRTLIMYVVIILAMRLMGKRQIGDLQPSELVITILISEIAAMPIQDTEIPLHYGIVASFTLAALGIFNSFLAMKSVKLRRLLYGRSAVIIENGVIDQKMLKKLRITVSDLTEVLRNQEVFDISEVAYAVLETNGQMSVLLKPQYMTATVNDLSGRHEASTMPCLIIGEGKLLPDAMAHIGISTDDISQILKEHRLKLNDVFLMTYDRNGQINIVKRNTEV